MLRGSRRADDYGPTYLVEHLAAFGVGVQFGLQWPEDGIRKLKQMERSSAIWAQKMILRLTPNTIVLEDENGDIVEQFPLHLVSEPSAHLSTDIRDVYNNLLIFVVNEEKQYNNRTPTEMHIFHCVRVSAKDVAEDIGQFLRSRFGSVKRGRSDAVHFPLKDNVHYPLKSDPYPLKSEPYPLKSEPYPLKSEPYLLKPDPYTLKPDPYPLKSDPYSLKQEPVFHNGGSSNGHLSQGFSLNTRVEYDAEPLNMGFERDVNTLNRCFDDVERFVTRIQQAALAQREIEALQQQKRRESKSSKFRQAQSEIGLQTRPQLPMESEFIEAKLRSHIHEPNAPELLHFLFTPFMVILDACQWGLGRNIASQVVSPLITREATNLLQHSLSSKEYEVWMSLGEAWKTPAEDWNGPAPVNFTPTFTNGFATTTNGQHKLPRQYNATTFDQMGHSAHLTDRNQGHSVILMDRSRDQTDDYKTGARHLADKEKFLQEKELKLTKLQKHLREEQQKVRDMMERVSLATPERDHHPTAKPAHRSTSQFREPFHESPKHSPSADAVGSSESSRQKMFLDSLKMKRAKVAQVTYDRVGQNSKELTVSKDEYLEILNDTKNWWEVRNMNNRIGFVPNTILHLIYDEGVSKFAVEQPISVKVAHASPSSGPPSAGFYNAQDHNGLNGRINGDGRRQWSSYSDQVTTEKRTKRVDLPR